MPRCTPLWILPFCATVAYAQDALPAGTRVRVFDPARSTIVAVGALARLTADSVTIVDTSGSRTVALSGRRRVETSLGRHRRVGQSMAGGAAVGGVIGLVLGAATWEPCPPEAWVCLTPSRAQTALLSGVLLAVPGALLGALAGSRERERWQRVPRSVPISVIPERGGARVAVSIGF